MANSDAPLNLPDWLKTDSPVGMPELAARDYICCLELHINFDLQLDAIRAQLARNNEARKARDDEIKKTSEYWRKHDGERSAYAVAQHLSLLHESVYHDAAHSMAAVGMLAPLIETIFEQCFREIGRRFSPLSAPKNDHERWATAHALQWDCHKVMSGGRADKDLVRGIKQLSEALGLWASFPSDLEKTLDALFGYRNKMFHCGFEWPKHEREKFQRRIESSGWPTTWFESATGDGSPWVFYITDEFIEHCLETAELIMTAFGAFVRDKLQSAAE